jgi:CRISPR/Cas system-associated exonuclease Cas4 (RecB family)|tara:strand:+ start:1133 stop:1861 length:729 start_codon:yes stop_codon:yes gene_type:complete
MLNIQKIYDDWLRKGNDLHYKKRYEGHEEWFHGSASGMCMRKHYFQHIAKVKPSSIDDNTLRLFRLGDLVHNDIQEALMDYASLNASQIMIEREIRIPDLNVRGFLDMIVVEDGALYDIKTCNAWKWRGLFGRKPDPDIPVNYNFQLGTYGLWYEKEYGNKLKKLSLLYYNKDNSRMREKVIPTSYINKAEAYWEEANKKFKKGNPPIELGVAPVYKWECNIKYCNFYQVCGGGLKEQGDDL